jgi:hypothetical protein
MSYRVTSCLETLSEGLDAPQGAIIHQVCLLGLMVASWTLGYAHGTDFCVPDFLSLFPAYSSRCGSVFELEIERMGLLGT